MSYHFFKTFHAIQISEIYNENKLSRKTRRGLLGRIKDDDCLVKLRNAIKNSKRRKKVFKKVKKIETELVKIKSAKNPCKLQDELKESIGMVVIDRKLHEIEQETFEKI